MSGNPLHYFAFGDGSVQMVMAKTVQEGDRSVEIVNRPSGYPAPPGSSHTPSWSSNLQLEPSYPPGTVLGFPRKVTVWDERYPNMDPIHLSQSGSAIDRDVAFVGGGLVNPKDEDVQYRLRHPVALLKSQLEAAIRLRKVRCAQAAASALLVSPEEEGGGVCATVKLVAALAIRHSLLHPVTFTRFSWLALACHSADPSGVSLPLRYLTRERTLALMTFVGDLAYSSFREQPDEQLLSEPIRDQPLCWSAGDAPACANAVPLDTFVRSILLVGATMSDRALSERALNLARAWHHRIASVPKGFQPYRNAAIASLRRPGSFGDPKGIHVEVQDSYRMCEAVNEEVVPDIVAKVARAVHGLREDFERERPRLEEEVRNHLKRRWWEANLKQFWSDPGDPCSLRTADFHLPRIPPDEEWGQILPQALACCLSAWSSLTASASISSSNKRPRGSDSESPPGPAKRARKTAAESESEKWARLASNSHKITDFLATLPRATTVETIE